MSNEFLWVEKYRPKKINDTILPQQLKDTFNAIVDKGDLPNMLLLALLALVKPPLLVLCATLWTLTILLSMVPKRVTLKP